MKQFLLIEDHEIIRMGIRMILASQYPGCNVEEAANEEEAMLLLAKGRFDMVLSDVHMPGSDIFRLIAVIREQLPKTPVLILSIGPENIFARKLLRAGAHGFVSKEAGADEMLNAIGLVMAGRKYISPSMAEYLSCQTGEEEDNPFPRLTDRELEICRLLIGCESITRISALLRISTSTAGTHKARILRKLRVDNVYQLIDLGKHYKLTS